ncbi:MAG: hypothetical protein FJY83_06130 [Candidatus Aminicenantes bacterium]|nr:hypothetical protein [Candidatus Aminicenantes bacterium]
MEKNAQVMGILWIVYGVLSVLGGIICLVGLLIVAQIPDIRWECGSIGPDILRIVAVSLGSFLIALGIIRVVSGIGLQARREWARILTLVLAFLSLINVPFGTALGIYSIVYLLKPEMIELFKPKTAPAVK